jgi:RimJ/RimL family protein N-acetyltransferase
VISLRRVEVADVDIFYEHQSDPVATEMAAFPARDRATHHEHWTKRVLVNPSGIARTVLVDGAVVGNIISWVDEDGRRLIGYWIGREFWGRGVASAALAEYLREVDERPLHAFVAVHNKGSRRVLEKNGFVLAAPQPEPDSSDIEELLLVLN